MEEQSGAEKPRAVSVPIYFFSFLGTVAMIIGGWISMNRSDAAQEERLKSLELQQTRTEQKIEAKTEKILDKLEEINTTLANKQDRSN
jgi:hypothetical protein